ncbi:thiol peroxidase [Yersinia enterocolitica]|nr:thiol peroxidase [Yersinia enterocolitica]
MTQTVHFQGNPVTVAGQLPQPGDKAKDFTLVAKDLSDVALSSFVGKRKVLNIFPSIDTGVCAASVRKFNQLAGDFRTPLFFVSPLTCHLLNHVFAVLKA